VQEVASPGRSTDATGETGGAETKKGDGGGRDCAAGGGDGIAGTRHEGGRGDLLRYLTLKTVWRRLYA